MSPFKHWKRRNHTMPPRRVCLHCASTACNYFLFTPKFREGNFWQRCVHISKKMPSPTFRDNSCLIQRGMQHVLPMAFASGTGRRNHCAPLVAETLHHGRRWPSGQRLCSQRAMSTSGEGLNRNMEQTKVV